MFASSSEPRPLTITPSAGTRAPGRSTTTSFTLRSAAGISATVPSGSLAQRRLGTERHQGLDGAAGAAEGPLLQSGRDAEQGQQNRTLEGRAHRRRGDGSDDHQQVDVEDVLFPQGGDRPPCGRQSARQINEREARDRGKSGGGALKRP